MMCKQSTGYCKFNIYNSRKLHNISIYTYRDEQLLGPMQPLLIQQPTNENPKSIDTKNKMSISQMLAVDPETQKVNLSLHAFLTNVSYQN